METKDAQRRATRTLVVVDEAIAGEELRDALLRRIGEDPGTVLVVAPTIVDSALKHNLGDVDDAVGPARERLRRSVETLRSAGIEAEGELGDADPIQAIRDELATFGPDRVFVVAHPDSEGAFAERHLIEHAERDLEVPIVELLVDRAKQPHLLGVERSEPHPADAGAWQPSGNMPPLTPRNLLGILVAVVGTVLVGFLASAADKPAAILIATGIALLNLAHVVGLFLFQSVGYEGIWSRFLATISLLGTPAAIVATAAMAIF